MSDTITAAELATRLASTEKPVLIDVRRKADADADPCRIPGAVWRDPAEAEAWAGSLSAGTTAVIYCVRGGSVSQSTLKTLRGAGIDAVFVEGGLAAWKESGGTVVPRS